VDFLPGLVAPRVGVFVTELGQQTHCVLYFRVIYFFVFISVYSSTMDKEGGFVNRPPLLNGTNYDY